MSEPVNTSRFAEDVPASRALLIPIVSVMLGSLITIVPVITTFPILPPFGLLVLLAWRLLRHDVLPIWAPLPFGLFDDLLSGQPLGSAMLLWTLAFFAIELVDTRMVWRDFFQDWLLAAGLISSCLVAGRFLASPISAHVDTMLVLQIVMSILAFPLVVRVVAWLDRKRGRA